MAVDGSDQQPLAQAARFAWARSGSKLLFTRGGPRVFRVEASGGRPVAVRARLGAAVTRSQRRTVFVRDRHVYLRDARGMVSKLT